MRWAGRAPGWRWLLAHELRMGWRGAGGAGMWVLVVAVAVFWTFGHLAGWIVMRNPSRLLAGGAVVTAGIVTWFVMLLIAATAFGLSIIALFERGDLDLLLSSPIPPRTILAVRGVAVAVQSLGFFAVAWIPFANGAIAHGHWELLATYPVLFAFGLCAVACAFASTLALVSAYGARRARTIAQIAGAFLGAAIFLAVQAFNFLPRWTQLKLIAWTRGDGQSIVGPDSVLWWPFRALMGEALPFVAVISICVGAFMIVVVRAERLFLDGSREAVVIPVKRALSTSAFVSGLSSVVIAKEMRLILRDPKLITGMLLQVLYLLPLFFLLLRKDSVHSLLAPTILLVASSLAGNLAFLTVSGEESPDLVGSAPVSRERVLWLKVAAAMLIPLAICVPFVAYYAAVSPVSCAIFAACLAGALASSAAVQIWTQKPGSPRDLRKRAQSSKLVNLMEFFSAAGWAAACYLLFGASWWAIAAAGFGLVAPTVAWLLRRGRRD